MQDIEENSINDEILKPGLQQQTQNFQDQGKNLEIISIYDTEDEKTEQLINNKLQDQNDEYVVDINQDLEIQMEIINEQIYDDLQDKMQEELHQEVDNERQEEIKEYEQQEADSNEINLQQGKGKRSTRLDQIVQQKQALFKRLVQNELNQGKQSFLIKHLKLGNSKGQFNFELLYKATVDGFKAKKFHQKCDNQGATISFILSNAGQIFGGYASQSWDASVNGYIKDKNAFLFNVGKKKIIYVKEANQKNALYSSEECLMSFGLGNDLHVHDDCHKENENYSFLGNSFHCPFECGKYGSLKAQKYLGGYKNFKVREIETYQVTQLRN
ncbi:UNKNOWN [Stylonychia lemnae]|uniref:TLDc domain-containing protein n=1 Tax=Stylonychia lemnae TaxID=5949 RepID=A0A078ABH8_STYLE|nr:UNKNOWN [Stylonychia lemnae]|eukprot:CDW79655.1 UNKNOWN [Stylonychia lemnae]